MAQLLLACSECRKVVAVIYEEGHVMQGNTDLAQFRICSGCSKEMVETERGDCGHVLLPGEDCTCRS